MKTLTRLGALALALSLCALGQNASLLPFPQQFFDANGYPLAGGLVYTCTAGATCGTSPVLNPLATYTDSGGGTAAPNPIVLDASGSAAIWGGSLAYKIVIENSAGVVLRTADNLYIANAGSVGSLAAAVSALQTSIGTNTSSRSLSTRANDTVSALDYAGADIGAKINAAIASLGVGCGVVVVPPASYTFATAINADDSIGCTIKSGSVVGGGGANKYISYTGTGATIVSAKSSTGFKLLGFNFIATNAAFAGKCVDLTHSATGGDTFMAEVSNNTCTANGGGLFSIGVDLDKVITSKVTGNNIQHATLGVSGTSSNASYSNGITISGNHFGASGGCMVSAEIANPGNAWVIENNTFEMGTACGIPKAISCIYPTPAAGISVTGNWVGDWGTGSTGTDFQVCGTGWTFAGNFIGTPVPSPGLVFDISNSTAGVQIGGNSFASGAVLSTLLNVGTGVKDVNFAGNGNINAVATLLAGTPVSGMITDASGGQTIYGTLNATAPQMNLLTSLNLPVTVGGSGAFFTGGYASPASGRAYIGNGSGYRFEFTKRLASVDTTLGWITDGGLEQMNTFNAVTAYQANGTAGATQVVNVRNSTNAGACTITYSLGLFISTTCP